jgi:Protein of unknown function (DUF1320)
VPYCQPADVADALVPEGDPFNNTAATLPVGQMQRIIRWSTALVNGYTGTTYDDVDVPDLIVSLTIDVAAYNAHLVMSKSRTVDARDPVAIRYANALETLLNIQKGIINPNPYNEDEPEENPLPGEAFVQNAYVGQLFDMSQFQLGPVSGSPIEDANLAGGFMGERWA